MVLDTTALSDAIEAAEVLDSTEYTDRADRFWAVLVIGPALPPVPDVFNRAQRRGEAGQVALLRRMTRVHRRAN